MLEVTSTKSRLEMLNLEIELLQAKAARIKRERLSVKAEGTRARNRLWYHKIAKQLRSPAESYVLWHFAVLLVGPMGTGALCLILVDTITDSLSVALWGSAIGATCAAIVLAALLYHPSDLQLPSRIMQADTDVRSANERFAQLIWIDGLADIEGQLRKLFYKRREVEQTLLEELAGPEGRRAALLQQDWRAMRGTEWEEFLVKVFQELGARVNRIGGAGDQGVDLIVEIEAKQIAVQAKGYEDAVNNKAVQEAFTGMTHYRCSACAVITNSRFQPSAYEIATSTNCILIGGHNFPDLVMGKLDLVRHANAVISSVTRDQVREIVLKLEHIRELDPLKDHRDSLADTNAHSGQP
jgi:hypothetical protein